MNAVDAEAEEEVAALEVRILTCTTKMYSNGKRCQGVFALCTKHWYIHRDPRPDFFLKNCFR